MAQIKITGLDNCKSKGMGLQNMCSYWLNSSAASSSALSPVYNIESFGQLGTPHIWTIFQPPVVAWEIADSRLVQVEVDDEFASRWGIMGVGTRPAPKRSFVTAGSVVSDSPRLWCVWSPSEIGDSKLLKLVAPSATNCHKVKLVTLSSWVSVEVAWTISKWNDSKRKYYIIWVWHISAESGIFGQVMSMYWMIIQWDCADSCSTKTNWLKTSWSCLFCLIVNDISQTISTNGFYSDRKQERSWWSK